MVTDLIVFEAARVAFVVLVVIDSFEAVAVEIFMAVIIVVGVVLVIDVNVMNVNIDVAFAAASSVAAFVVVVVTNRDLISFFCGNIDVEDLEQALNGTIQMNLI